MSVDVGSAKGYLRLDISEFKSALKDAINESKQGTKSIETSFADVGKNLEATGKKMTTIFTAPILAGAGAAVKLASDFEFQMDKVQAISGATADEMEKLSAKAREMGSATMYSAKEAGEAFEYMALAGWDAAQATEAIEPVLKLAGAAAMDLGTASDIVTDYMTAFKMEASEAAHFTDVLATTMSKSNTNVEMLGEAFKYIAPLAGNLNYSVEDVSLALGVMANSGIKASQAGTSLRRMVLNLTDPSEKTAWAMERLGLSLFNLDGSAKPLRSVLEELRSVLSSGSGDVETFKTKMTELSEAFEQGKIDEEEYEYQIEDLIQLTGIVTDEFKAQNLAAIAGATGMSGLAAVVAASEEDWNKLASAIDNCDGAASDMYDTMQDNLQGQLTILSSAVQEMGISFGELLLPVIKDVIKGIQGLVDKVNSLDDRQKKAILNIAKVVAAVGPVLLIGGKLIVTISSLSTALTTATAATTALGGAASLLASPWLGVIAIAGTAVASLVAIGIALNDNITETERLQEELNTLSETVNENVENWNSFKDAQAEVVASQQNTLSHTQDYRNELENLLNKQGELTEEEKQRADFLMSKMAESIGVEIDKNKDLQTSMQDLITEFDKLYEKKEAQIYIDSLNEGASKAMVQEQEIAQNGLEIWDRLQEAKELLTQKTNALAEAEKNSANYMDEFGGDGGILQSYGKEVSDARKLVEDLTEELNKNSAMQEECTRTIETAKQAEEAAYTGNYDKVKQIYENWNADIIKHTELVGKSEEEQVTILAQQVVDTQAKVDELIAQRKAGDKTITDNMIAEAQRQAQAAALEFDKVGNNITSGTERGMLADKVMGPLLRSARSIVQKIKNAMNSEAEAHSPARLFSRTTGTYITTGVAKGMDDNTYVVINSAKGMIQSVAKASQKQALGNETGNIIAKNVGTGWTSAMPQVENEIQNDLNKAVDNLSMDDVSISPGAKLRGDLTDYTEEIKPVYVDFADWLSDIEDRMIVSINSIIDKFKDLISQMESVRTQSKEILKDINNTVSSMRISSGGGGSASSSSGGGGSSSSGGGSSVGHAGLDTVISHYAPDGRPVFVPEQLAAMGYGGVTNNFNFTTDKPIDEIEASRLIKKTYSDIAEGFAIA